MMDNNTGMDLMGSCSLFKKKIWRVKDVSEYLQLSVGTIYNKTSKGEIPTIKKGKTLYFLPDQIKNWLMEGNL